MNSCPGRMLKVSPLAVLRISQRRRRSSVQRVEGCMLGGVSSGWVREMKGPIWNKERLNAKERSRRKEWSAEGT